MSVKNKLAASYQYVGMCVPTECVSVILEPSFAENTQNKFNSLYQEAKNSTYVPFEGMKFINPLTDKPHVWKMLD